MYNIRPNRSAFSGRTDAKSNFIIHQKLVLQPQNFWISSGTNETLRLWERFTFCTTQITQLENGDYEGERDY